MEQTELLKRINELEREIALLPSGSIAVKRINDKEYYYHRINENGNVGRRMSTLIRWMNCVRRSKSARRWKKS